MASKAPKKLAPIQVRIDRAPSILCPELEKDAREKARIAQVEQMMIQLQKVADIAEIGVSELLENRALLRFATKTYGLFSCAATDDASIDSKGRPAEWGDDRLFHLWSWVEQDGAANISESIRRYGRRFDVAGMNFSSLRARYYKSLESPLVVLVENLRKHPRTAPLADEAIDVFSTAFGDIGSDWFDSVK